MRAGYSVKINSIKRKEHGKVGTIKVVRPGPSKFNYIVFFEDGDSNDFKKEELVEVVEVDCPICNDPDWLIENSDDQLGFPRCDNCQGTGSIYIEYDQD